MEEVVGSIPTRSTKSLTNRNPAEGPLTYPFGITIAVML